jgi:hypothetical protein
MMTKRYGLKPLLAALSLTLCAAADAQVVGGQLTGRAGAIGNLGGPLGSPVLNGAVDGTLSGTLDADTELRRAGRQAESTATRAKRDATRKTKAERDAPAKHRHEEPTAQLMSTATAAASLVPETPGAGKAASDATRHPEPAMPRVQGDANGALDAAVDADASAPAEARANAAWTGSAQATVD